MNTIRQATAQDLYRIAEMHVFNFRLNYYPIFLDDMYYFGELQVPAVVKRYENQLDTLFVYDDGVVKGFTQIIGTEIKKLYVEPSFHNSSIGSQLLEYAVREHHADHLWALEKNIGAIRLYKRHGFILTGEKIPEEDTAEFLVMMRRKPIPRSDSPIGMETVINSV